MTSTATLPPTACTVTAYALADMAGCASPDSMSSPGARFLLDIARQVVELPEDERDGDAASYVADDAVPVYTSDVWAIFTDLAAWQEDPSDLGDSGSDLTASARVALYMIGERLAAALIGERV